MQTFPPIAPGEAVPLTYIFSPGLATGETLSAIIGVSIAVLQGTDPNAAAVLSGNPGLDSTSMDVIVPVTGQISGVVYEITVTVATSNTQKTLVLSAALPVRSGL
jgi:hypothetical protein